uniref:Putative ticsk ixostatin n=1 Tax=Ixodes ricinus TaxID=34613 RepID=A0A147BFH1_IXORI
MKVVCIVLLFVIAADAASTKESPVVKAQNGQNKIKLNFPRYLPNHYGFASRLLGMCEEYKQETQGRDDDSKNTYHPRINDLQVDFKNCTFLCKRKFGNVILALPSDTPCGPNNQVFDRSYHFCQSCKANVSVQIHLFNIQKSFLIIVGGTKPLGLFLTLGKHNSE